MEHVPAWDRRCAVYMVITNDTDRIREAVREATRRTVRRLWITCATVVMVWSVVIALVQ